MQLKDYLLLVNKIKNKIKNKKVKTEHLTKDN